MFFVSSLVKEIQLKKDFALNFYYMYEYSIVIETTFFLHKLIKTNVQKI